MSNTPILKAFLKVRGLGALLGVGFICLFLVACDGILSSEIENKTIITEEDFHRARGHKLGYDIYLPSTWTGWVHQDHCLFEYNPDTESYFMERIVIGQREVDDLGSRFKISSRRWRYQFNFGSTGVSPNESTLGFDGSVVARMEFTTAGGNDMGIEFDENQYESMQGKILSFEMKVLDSSAKPDALLLIKLKEQSEIMGAVEARP